MEKNSKGQFYLGGIIGVIVLAFIAIFVFLFLLQQLKLPEKLVEEQKPLADIRDPSQTQIQEVKEISEKIPKPYPSGDNWRIAYGDPDTLPGTFHIKIDAKNSIEEVIKATNEAHDAFRQFGYDPCNPPLAGLIAVEIVKNPPQFQGPPPPEYKSWKPCK